MCGTPLQFGTYSESEKKTEEYDTQVSGVLLAVATRGEGPSWVWGLPHLSRDPGKLPAGFLTQEGALGAPRPQSCGPLRHVLSCWEMSSSPWGCGAVSQVPSATWGYPPPRGFRVPPPTRFSGWFTHSLCRDFVFWFHGHRLHPSLHWVSVKPGSESRVVSCLSRQAAPAWSPEPSLRVLCWTSGPPPAPSRAVSLAVLGASVDPSHIRGGRPVGRCSPACVLHAAQLHCPRRPAAVPSGLWV